MKRIALIGSKPIIGAALNEMITKLFVDVEVEEFRDIPTFKQSGSTPDMVVCGLKEAPVPTQSLAIKDLTGIAKVGVIVYDEIANPKNTLSYYKAGALGSFSLNDDVTTISACLNTVAEGKRYVNGDFIYFLLKQTPENTVAKTKKSVLSYREKEIATHLVQGHKVTSIAQLLSLSLSTVSTIKKSVFRKMKVDNIISLKEQMEFAGVLA